SLKRARHYRAIGLLPERKSYDERDVHSLCFIRRARALGFHVGETRALLDLWQDRERPAGEVQSLAQRHAKQIRTRIAVLQAMLLALRQLTEGCSAPVVDDEAIGTVVARLVRALHGDAVEKRADAALHHAAVRGMAGGVDSGDEL